MQKVKDIEKIREKKRQRKQAIKAAIRPKAFKRASKLVGCDEALATMFKPANGIFFRIVHNPLEHNDELVQSEQNFEGLAPSMPNIAETITFGSSLEDQFDHISSWSLSFNINDSSLADFYWHEHDKRITPTQKDNFVRRKGTHIAKYHFTPNAGLIQNQIDENGHTVLVEYEDFVLDEYRVQEFGFKPLTDYIHIDNE